FNISKVSYSIIGISLFLWLSGCASLTDNALNDSITIERVNSKSAEIGHTYIQKSDGGWILRGKLSRRFLKQGRIPGHLHVEILSAEMKLLKQAKLDYKRISRKSRYSKFYHLIPFELKKGVTVRIIHHDLLSHQDTKDEKA
ncbi:MAG: hypothetical protein AB2802_21010, partial [Candidatus Thiodiazotropha endolucinida]